MEMKNSIQKYGRFLFGVQCNKNIIYITFYLPFSILLFAFISLFFSQNLLANNSPSRNFGIYLKLVNPAVVITNSDVNYEIITINRKNEKYKTSLVLLSRIGFLPTIITSKNISIIKTDYLDQLIIHKAKISTRVFDHRIEIPPRNYIIFQLRVAPSTSVDTAPLKSDDNRITFLYEWVIGYLLTSIHPVSCSLG